MICPMCNTQNEYKTRNNNLKEFVCSNKKCLSFFLLDGKNTYVFWFNYGGKFSLKGFQDINMTAVELYDRKTKQIKEYRLSNFYSLSLEELNITEISNLKDKVIKLCKFK